MAQLTEVDFYLKWVPLLADNEFQNIDGPRLALLLADLRDSALWANSPNVPTYDPDTVYPIGQVVRYSQAGGRESFYYSLKAGLLPHPTYNESDTNWKLVPGPVAALALAQFMTLAEAQGIDGVGVVPGRRYGVTGKWNGAQTEELVMLDGFENYFRKRGTLLRADGTQLEVDVDVQAETYVAAGNGNGTGGPGGTSYTDAQAATAAAASLVAGNSQHEGVVVSVVNGVPKLQVLYGLVEVLRFKMPAPGPGNLGNTSDDRPAGTSGSYKLTSAANVAHLQVIKAGPSTIYDGDVAGFPNTGAYLEELAHYEFTFTPIDSTLPLVVVFTATI